MLFYDVNFGEGICYFENLTAVNTSFYFRSQIINTHIIFSFINLKKLVFENCTNHNVIEINDVIAVGRNKQINRAITELAFINVCNLGTIRLKWDLYKKALFDYEGDVFIQDLEESKTEEFQMLKENFHNQGQYDWEDEAYVEFKRLYTKRLNHPIRKGLLNLLFKVGKFGTDYMSIAMTMLIVVVAWGFLYTLPWASIYPGDAVGHWWSPFYYSVITFFTVGYGDLSAQNLYTAICCAVESFLGVFLMSYFSVAVVRKILR